MFRSAFLSEYSFSESDQVQHILKSHLLSNGFVVIPAAAFRKFEVAETVALHLPLMVEGAIKIAHGNDCNDLPSYLDKYPDTRWPDQCNEIFREFQNKEATAIYDLTDTFYQFNATMRRLAKGEIATPSSIFSNSKVSQSILNAEDRNLHEYFDLFEKVVADANEKAQANAYLKYLYNLCGALSTDSGNTFSIENARAFKHIQHETSYGATDSSGLQLLISCALDVTDGLEDFTFLDDMSDRFFDDLSFEEVLEVRADWLHETIIETYEKLVKECVKAIGSSEDNAMAIMHIERAFELKSNLIQLMHEQVKKEIRAYKLHRVARFLADSSISLAEFLSGISLIKSIGQGLASATTEIAVLTNRERRLNRFIRDKKKKVEVATNKAQVLLRAKSPTLEYLRLVSSRLAG